MEPSVSEAHHSTQNRCFPSMHYNLHNSSLALHTCSAVVACHKLARCATRGPLESTSIEPFWIYCLWRHRFPALLSLIRSGQLTRPDRFNDRSSPVNSHSICSNWYYKLIWSRSLYAILCGCNRRCLQDVLKRFQDSETTSGARGGASGASRLIFQSASRFASGTACFIFTIERTLKKQAEWGIWYAQMWGIKLM